MHPRRHPLFPTIAEVESNPELAYSDHLPILVKTVGSVDKEINMISLNTLGPSACSGLHASKKWETDEETRARYQRIVDGLANGVELHDVGIIALQETVPDFIVPHLQNALGEDWEIVAENRVGMATCFNKQKYTLLKSVLTEETRICSLTLQDNNEDSVFILHNIWGIYDPMSYRMEAMLRKFLEADEHRSVIIGDFNSRIAPLDNTLRNIATGVVPVIFNEENGAEENVQITDYPDGAFVRNPETGSINQLEAYILDFTTGEIVEDKRTKEEIKPWLEYRMILTLDESFKELQIISAYQEKLQEQFNEKSIRVQVAANSFNEKAVCVRLPIKLKSKYNQIKDLLKDEEGFQFKLVEDAKAGSGVPCIFAPLNKLSELVKAFDRVIMQDNPLFSLARNSVPVTDRNSNNPHEFEIKPGFFARFPLMRDLLIGAAIGLVVFGGIFLGAFLGGGMPLIFGVLGAALFGLTKAAAIGAGAATIGVFSIWSFSVFTAMAVQIYTICTRTPPRGFQIIENPVDVPLERVVSNHQQSTKNAVWSPKKTESLSAATKPGIGLWASEEKGISLESEEDLSQEKNLDSSESISFSLSS